MPGLVLGPMLRYVDERVATIWVQTDAACEVEILGARERTWCVDGLHFALVAVEGLDAGARSRLRGAPRRGARLARGRLAASRRARSACWTRGARRDIVFGSCRITLPHEPPYVLRADEHPAGQGIDALRTYALRAARGRRRRGVPGHAADARRPDLRRRAVAGARAARSPPASVRPDAPDDELADFAEYALAYREAWSEPAIRWLLSTVPTTMVFDDHEIHAEWRISQGWLDEMNAEPWFDRHIRAGLMAYWVFQHLGNLSPGDLAEAGLYDAVRVGARTPRELLAVADGHGGTPGRPQPLELRARRRRGPAGRHRLPRRARRHARAARARAGRGVGVDPRAGAHARPGTCCSPARCRSCSRRACTTSRRSTRR